MEFDIERLAIKRPFKFTIICTKTGRVFEQNHAPTLDQLETWEDTPEPGIKERRQTKTAYINTRYEAELRLFNYILKKRGLEIPRYKPFDGTQIGKTLPILNF